jgi:hypothetical protein
MTRMLSGHPAASGDAAGAEAARRSVGVTAAGTLTAWNGPVGDELHREPDARRGDRTRPLDRGGFRRDAAHRPPPRSRARAAAADAVAERRAALRCRPGAVFAYLRAFRPCPTTCRSRCRRRACADRARSRVPTRALGRVGRFRYAPTRFAALDTCLLESGWSHPPAISPELARIPASRACRRSSGTRDAHIVAPGWDARRSACASKRDGSTRRPCSCPPATSETRTSRTCATTGRIAVCFSRAIDHRSMQVKGRVLALTEANEADRAHRSLPRRVRAEEWAFVGHPGDA